MSSSSKKTRKQPSAGVHRIKIKKRSRNEVKKLRLKRKRNRLKEKKELEIKASKKIKKETVKKEDKPDILQEQIEKPLTTVHCPESIKENELSNVRKTPENYIEINMINKNRMVDNFYIGINYKSFRYRKKRYNINEKKIYLLPSKSGFFMLTSFYIENQIQAKDFQNTNKGITSKALTILYNERLYNDLFAPDETKYNFFIAIFSVVNLILYTIGLYLLTRGSI